MIQETLYSSRQQWTLHSSLSLSLSLPPRLTQGKGDDPQSLFGPWPNPPACPDRSAKWGPLRIILMDPSVQSQRPVLDVFGAWLPGKVILENQVI